MKTIKQTILYTHSWSPLLKLFKRENDYCKLMKEYSLLHVLTSFFSPSNRAARKLDKKLDNVNNEEY